MCEAICTNNLIYLFFLTFEPIWNGYPTLISTNISLEVISLIKMLHGNKVNDYIEESDSSSNKKWKWKTLPEEGKNRAYSKK